MWHPLDRFGLSLRTLIRSLGAPIQGRDLSASSGGEPVEAAEAEILPEDLRRMSDPSFTPGR